MTPETATKLRDLRANVLQELVGLSDQMVDDEDVSYDILLTLARTSGNQLLLEKAFRKIQAIEDPKQKSDALLDLMDEIEAELSVEHAGQQADAPTAETPEGQSTDAEQQPNTENQ